MKRGAILKLSPARLPELRHGSLVVLSYSALFTAFFSPVLFTNHLLSPGDSLIYYLPNFYARRVLWDHLILGGFPAFADPQMMFWYPPAIVLSLVGSWSAFMLSAYVLASSFTYGYVYTVTGSRLAAAVSGIVYGLGGTMIAHLGHVTIIHAAAWLPLIIWSLEKLRTKSSVNWLVIGSLAVACNFLAHPQIFFYSLLICGAFALAQGWRAPLGRWRFYGASLGIVVLGIGLSAIQLLPTFEMTYWTVREQMGFPEFVSYSLPLKQIAIILFPFLYGGDTTTYFGAWNIAELTCFAGLLPLMLSAIGASVWPQRSVALFWLAVVLFTFCLMLGDATPLARLAFQVPVINKFRALARFSLPFTFAISVLSGLGVSSMIRGLASRRLVILICMTLLAVMLGSLVLILRSRAYLQDLARVQGVMNFTVVPWKNWAIGVPLVIVVASAVLVVLWCFRPQSNLMRAGLIILVLVDLSSFGWFNYWRYMAPPDSSLDMPDIAKEIKPVLLANHQRLLPIRGGLGSVAEIMPNISRLWGVPNASAYGPLLLRRIGRMASMNPGGAIELSSLNDSDQSINLLAVRFITQPVPQPGVDLPDLSSPRWRHIEDTRGMSLYENRSPMPRVWLVPESIRLSADDALSVIKTSKFSDGRAYNPAQIALVEQDQFAYKAEHPDPNGSATVLQLTDNRMTVQTNTGSPSFLVTSDNYYPGWNAAVDGAPVGIAKVDYALRGVSVPAGSHTVTFTFTPKSFWQGAAISAISILVLAFVWFLLGFRARRRQPSFSHT